MPCLQLLANPDRRKRLELLKQVLELGKTLKDPQLQEEAEVRLADAIAWPAGLS